MPNFQPVRLRPEPLVDAARALFGERQVIFAGFVDDDTDCRPYWFLEHTLEGTRFDLGGLLRSRAFAQSCPELASGVSPERMFSFTELEPLALIPALVATLAGGSPSGAPLSLTEAHELATNFVYGWIESGLDELVVLHSRVCWSDWFACDVWDQTWVIASRDGRSVTLLCLTGGHPPRNG